MPSPVTEPSVLDVLIKAKDLPNQLSDDVTEKIRNSGAGFLADLVKMAERDGEAVDLTGQEARDSGAGSVQDILRAIEEPPPAPVDPPTLTELVPAMAFVGGEDITITITGTGFTPDTVLVWNGADDTCTFVSDTELTTLVKVSLSTVAVDVPVAVRNGDVTSNELSFSFKDAPAP